MSREFCLFCGAQPQARSKEHIVPRWLITLTGDPKRKVPFGPFYSEKTKELEVRSFSFDEFAFPACAPCNSRFSSLESATKQVMTSLLAKRPLKSSDFHTLLTWLDKVRVGLWLIGYVIQKNLSDIAPQFHVNSRIDMFDRMLLIYRSDYTGSRLRFGGVSAPAFQYSPTCFSLIVNDLVFFNVSTDFLLSKSMGFPYPARISYTDTPRMEVELRRGLDRVTYPLIRVKYDRNCSEIYQPMIKGAMDWRWPYYDSAHVRSWCADYSNGIGKVLYCYGPSVTEYNELDSPAWIPRMTWDDSELMNALRKQLLEFQIHLLEYGPMERKIGFGNTSKAKRRLVKEQVGMAKRINMTFLSRATKT
jgi:hypothetical protein